MTYEIHCRKCGRYLGSGSESMNVSLKCANCKSLLEYHFIDLAEYVPPQGTMETVHKPS